MRVAIRGARLKGSRVVTSAYAGSFGTSPALRAEFLRLTGAPARRPGSGLAGVIKYRT